jgi:hypothetical protein
MAMLTIVVGVMLAGCTSGQWEATQQGSAAAAGALGDAPAPQSPADGLTVAANVAGAVGPVVGAAFGPLGVAISATVASILSGIATWQRTRKATATKIVASIEKAKVPATGGVDWEAAAKLQEAAGVRGLVRAVR